MENNNNNNNVLTVSIPITEYGKLLEINFKYSILLNSILKKHNVGLSWDKQDLTLRSSAEELLMEIIKTFETKRYNQVFEEIAKEENKKEN